MKIRELIILLTLGTGTLRAQDAAPPSVDLYSGEKQQATTATPSPGPNGPDVPELSQLDEAFKKTSLGKKADEQQLHIEWRRLKNQVVRDPSVRAAEAATHTAHTDLEKRKRLREYYDVYYARMAALASTAQIKVALQALKGTHINQTSQPRVRPTPTPEGYTPAPAPTPAHKQKKHKK